MTGTMHVADHHGDTTHTWDTADPATVQEIEELFRQARATGAWSKVWSCTSVRQHPTSRLCHCQATLACGASFIGCPAGRAAVGVAATRACGASFLA
jgi:hypothetical protein